MVARHGGDGNAAGGRRGHVYRTGGSGYTPCPLAAAQEKALSATKRSFKRLLADRIVLRIPNRARHAAQAARAAEPVEAAAVMRRFSPAEHVARADAYFEREGELAQLFRRPFQDDPGTQPRLYGLSAVLQLADLRRDMRVLDFGCGLGWLSRCLATMGMAVVGVDVSARALALARDWLARDPLAPELRVEFRPFDSVRLPVEDASMDRVISFDAFHHVLDQAATLREMARVLRPGGLAVFHEPGPEHSRTADAQYEMRTFEVIENDIDVHRIWAAAQDAGFTGLRMALPLPQAPVVDLAAFDRVAAGRPALSDARHVLQGLVDFSYNLRVFALQKAGPPG